MKIARAVSERATNSISIMSGNAESKFPGAFNSLEKRDLAIHLLHCAINEVDYTKDLPCDNDLTTIAIDSLYLDATELVSTDNPEFTNAVQTKTLLNRGKL